MSKLLFRKVLALALIIFTLIDFKVKGQTSNFKVLVVASQAKDHWKSISAAKEFFQKMGADNHFGVDFTDDTSKH
jgi:hypothetical protein